MISRYCFWNMALLFEAIFTAISAVILGKKRIHNNPPRIFRSHLLYILYASFLTTRSTFQIYYNANKSVNIEPIFTFQFLFCFLSFLFFYFFTTFNFSVWQQTTSTQKINCIFYSFPRLLCLEALSL